MNINDSTLAAQRGYIASCVLLDGRVLDLEILTFARGRLMISRSIDEDSWEDGWDFDILEHAVAAFMAWNPARWNRETNEGEPWGWRRAMNRGREDRYSTQGDTTDV